MHPGAHDPQKTAVVMADTGASTTFGELEERSVRLAHVLTGAGLRPGDGVALVATNDTRFFEVYWACLRSGLYLTPVNSHLSTQEVTYVVEDCDASALVVSADLDLSATDVAAAVPGLAVRLAWGGTPDGFEDYDTALAAASAEPPADQPRGADLLYSSGTTGRPKGIKSALPERQVGDPGDPYVAVFGDAYAFGPESVYFSPAPLYHAAPLRFGMVAHSLGGTVVSCSRFDAEGSLRAIAEHGVTHSQWVPTHFVRMLRLPAEVRERHDLSTLTHAVHAAAPCPVEVKRAMIDWWGPVLHEYYASTEAAGVTMIDSPAWLSHPGSVGTAQLGVLHICDEGGHELPPGGIGTVWFEREEMPFGYHKDPAKTRAAEHPEHPGWSTVGDIGRLDEEGYLYLTDRAAFMIISGGVNIYPQEIEDCLVMHPEVHDVAVVGVPHEEMGESVVAVVQSADGVEPTPEAAERLVAHVRERLAGYKVPRRVEFVPELPRTATGKLVKGPLREELAGRSVLAAAPDPD